MKNLTLTLTVLTFILLLSCNRSSIDKNQTVNPILGDISYERKFGSKPTSTTSNHIRVSTHLEYVENLLRKTDVSGISTELQARRKSILDLFHTYWTNGVYPKNYDYADQRKPCFIDRDGNICAVGYLIEQTTSRQVADEINNNYKYQELLAMNDQTINNWVSTSGLTKEEFAMIQPAYAGDPTSNNYISPRYGISSSIITGLNVSINAVNGRQIVKGSTNRTVPVLGIITGVSQVLLGSASYPGIDGTWGYNENVTQKNLSMLNIGLGTSTVFLSAWNLVANRTPKDKLTTWNIYSFPTENNSNGLAFNMKRNF